MAAKAWGSQQKAVDEVFFQNEAVSLCMLINRRARTMRVVDFRAGPTNAKRLFVQSVAQREGVEKVYTLVERDEVQTWHKMGFLKEASIPGFYKRSDAFLLGCTVPALGEKPIAEAAEAGLADDAPLQSETRLAVVSVSAVGAPAPAIVSPRHERMERTIVAGKRIAKELKEFAEKLPTAKVTEVDETYARRAVAAALRAGRALTAFEPFGRDIKRRYFAVTVRGGFELVVSTESQSCFGNAYLELLQSPRTDAEKIGTTAAVHALCEKLLAEETVSCFSLAPSDDVALASAFVYNGFRRTGLLVEHLLLVPGPHAQGQVASKRADAILWSRKLNNPADQ
jgi:hypothetical protein